MDESEGTETPRGPAQIAAWARIALAVLGGALTGFVMLATARWRIEGLPLTVFAVGALIAFLLAIIGRLPRRVVHNGTELDLGLDLDVATELATEAVDTVVAELPSTVVADLQDSSNKSEAEVAPAPRPVTGKLYRKSRNPSPTGPDIVQQNESTAYLVWEAKARLAEHVAFERASIGTLATLLNSDVRVQRLSKLELPRGPDLVFETTERHPAGAGRRIGVEVTLDLNARRLRDVVAAAREAAADEIVVVTRGGKFNSSDIRYAWTELIDAYPRRLWVFSDALEAAVATVEFNRPATPLEARAVFVTEDL